MKGLDLSNKFLLLKYLDCMTSIGTALDLANRISCCVALKLRLVLILLHLCVLDIQFKTGC